MSCLLLFYSIFQIISSFPFITLFRVCSSVIISNRRRIRYSSLNCVHLFHFLYIFQTLKQPYPISFNSVVIDYINKALWNGFVIFNEYKTKKKLIAWVLGTAAIHIKPLIDASENSTQ